MAPLTKSDWIAGVAVVLALVVTALAAVFAPPETRDLGQAIAGAVGIGAVAFSAWAADEVARLRALKAASIAFFVCLALAWMAPLVLGESAMIFQRGWAIMMGAWLVAWLALRARQ